MSKPDPFGFDMSVSSAKKKNPRGRRGMTGASETSQRVCDQDGCEEAAGEKIDAIVNLEVDDEVIAARLTGRRSCPKCGAVYHIDNLKPKVEGVCDKNGEQLVQREDDKPEVVSNRLKTYHEQTAAVVDYYESKGNPILNVDAGMDIDAVTESIFCELDKIISQG